jgi:DNA-binding response OmpR family regulator
MPKSILMVDLGSAKGAELGAALQAKGFRVTRCDSVVSLDTALKGLWDLILTEWDFYHLRGSRLIELLKPARQPILVCSRQDTGSIAAEALEAGARGVFSTFGRAELLDEIERQIYGSPGILEEGDSIVAS